MAKSLCILMLVATQLLAGSRGSVYLCISNDGSFCCFDAGPESCTCCHHEDDSTSCPDACCNSTYAETKPQACDHHEDHSSSDGHRLPTPKYPSLQTGDHCGCTHQLVSVKQVASVQRSTVNSEAVDALLLYSPVVLHQHTLAEVDPHGIWRGPPPMRDAALVALATVVIRC